MMPRLADLWADFNRFIDVLQCYIYIVFTYVVGNCYSDLSCSVHIVLMQFYVVEQILSDLLFDCCSDGEATVTLFSEMSVCVCSCRPSLCVFVYGSCRV